MSPFELAAPSSLAEAIALLEQEGARPLAGGTALMLMMKAGVLRPPRLVGLHRLKLSTIEGGSGASLRIGAMATLSALERSAEMRKGWPVIARTLRTLSNVRVRNVATVGGALAHADPHMDLPPLLSALGAKVLVHGRNGQRALPVEDLYAGYLENTLKEDELITSMTTICGFSLDVSSTASRPFPASPTTSMSGSSSSNRRKPRRTRAWSSTTNTVITLPGEPLMIRAYRNQFLA